MKKQKNYALYEVQPFDDFQDMLEKAVPEAGDVIAFRYKINKQIRDVTYKRFKEDVDILGAALCRLGIQNKHIAMVGENSYRWINLYLSVLCSSGVYVPVDKELPPEEIFNIINDSDSEVVFFSKTYFEKVYAHKDELPKVKYFFCFDADDTYDDCTVYGAEIKEGEVNDVSELFVLGRLALSEKDDTFYRQENVNNDMKLLVYTSGTTGVAKGVMLSKQNLISGVYYGLQVSTVYDTCLSVLPYHHTYEAVCGILVSLHKHATICINESLRSVAENLKLYKPSYIMLVPLFVETLYKKVWKEAEKSNRAETLRKLISMSNCLRNIGIDLRKPLFKSVRAGFGGRLKKIVCGGAPVRKELGDFFDAVGITLINGYGITECSPLVSANRDYYNDCTTVGVPLPCAEIKIEDKTEEGIGEICVRGPIVMLGYYKNEAATEEVLNDGWFATGDYGMLDDEGRIVITGRKKNIIVLKNGKNIYPEEIEAHLEPLPLVSEVAVYAEFDENGDETGLCAEIFPDAAAVKEQGIADIKKSLTEEIKKACEKLPGYKHISKIVVRDKEFEKTTSKKIKRNGLGGKHTEGNTDNA